MPDSNRILVTKKALRENPHADWNAFIQLLATTAYSKLTPAQLPAHLIFWYESEVQNGGHLQYFINRGSEEAAIAVECLIKLGADNQARILEQALAKWNAAARLRPADVLEYVGIARECDFSDVDRAFYDCPVQLIDVLKRHFAEKEPEFIVRE